MSLIDSIVGAESGGNPNAQNPNSSASGPGQFIDSTWLSTIKSARPDLAQGQSDADLLALKNDPQLSREMTQAYANQNQAILKQNGLPVTDGTTYLAHFAGPGGAVKVLQADPNASVADILGPAVVKANPFLQGMTAQGLQAWASRKMGAGVPQPAPQQPAPQEFAAQQPNAAQSLLAQMPAQMTPLQPQFARPHQVDLSKLRAQLARAPIFSRG